MSVLGNRCETDTVLLFEISIFAKKNVNASSTENYASTSHRAWRAQVSGVILQVSRSNPGRCRRSRCSPPREATVRRPGSSGRPSSASCWRRSAGSRSRRAAAAAARCGRAGGRSDRGWRSCTVAGASRGSSATSEPSRAAASATVVTVCYVQRR